MISPPSLKPFFYSASTEVVQTGRLFFSLYVEALSSLPEVLWKAFKIFQEKRHLEQWLLICEDRNKPVTEERRKWVWRTFTKNIFSPPPLDYVMIDSHHHVTKRDAPTTILLKTEKFLLAGIFEGTWDDDGEGAKMASYSFLYHFQQEMHLEKAFTSTRKQFFAENDLVHFQCVICLIDVKNHLLFTLTYGSNLDACLFERKKKMWIKVPLTYMSTPRVESTLIEDMISGVSATSGYHITLHPLCLKNVILLSSSHLTPFVKGFESTILNRASDATLKNLADEFVSLPENDENLSTLLIQSLKGVI